MPWSHAKKIGFRFLFCYLLLFTTSNILILGAPFNGIWRKLVPWFADQFLNLAKPITIFTNGSGDTTYNYVSLLVFALLASISTVIWSILDRRKKDYQQMLGWLTIWLRCFLVLQMMVYGLAKVFYFQFRPEQFSQLVQTYGDSSPMRLLWTFMGHSRGYTVFTGLGEVLGGFLLIFRKTQTLGAMIVFGVMANVMALNYFYDVPVKILSTHLVLISGFLMLLDGRRLLHFFFLNKPTEPISPFPVIEAENLRMAKGIIKWMIVSLSLLVILGMMFSRSQSIRNREKPPLFGLHEVTQFEKNGELIPPLITDSLRWRRLMIEGNNWANMQMMTGKIVSLKTQIDTVKQQIKFNFTGDTSQTFTFSYIQRDSNLLSLDGQFGADTLKIEFQTKQKEDFQLIRRKFRWISEYPFNR